MHKRAEGSRVPGLTDPLQALVLRAEALEEAVRPVLPPVAAAADPPGLRGEHLEGVLEVDSGLGHVLELVERPVASLGAGAAGGKVHVEAAAGVCVEVVQLAY